ncbi:MAG: hypothetical protein ACI4Q3_00510 [Kiritimatiellia bacterium]
MTQKREKRDLRREAELAVIGSLLTPTTQEATIKAIKRSSLGADSFATRDTAAAFAQILIDAKSEWGIMDTSAEAIGRDLATAKALARIGKEKEAVEKVVDNARQEKLFTTIQGITDKVANYPNAIQAGRALQDALKRFERDAQKLNKPKGRLLGSYDYPGPDEEDDHCLFQNRYLRRGMAGMIVAGSGVGKSVVSIQLAYHWAVGKTCLGITPTKKTAATCKAGRSLPDGGMKIAIFQSEDDEYDMQNFRRGITNGLIADGWTSEEIKLAESRVSCYGIDEIGGQDIFSFMSAVQDDELFDMAFINPLFGFYEGDIKDNEEARRWLRGGLDPLIKRAGKEFGCWIVHHTPKPKLDDLKDGGNVFAAYIGNGASEFTNYPRVTLAFVPWKSAARGSVPSRTIFRLVAGKHACQLGWKGFSGSNTDEKIVCYSYLVDRYKDAHAIYWAEPDEEEWKAIRDRLAEEAKNAKEEREAEAAQPEVDGVNQSDFPLIERAATWVRATEKLVGPEDIKRVLSSYAKVGPKSSRVARMMAILVAPGYLSEHGLAEWKDGRSHWYGTADAIAAAKERNKAESLDF